MQQSLWQPQPRKTAQGPKLGCTALTDPDSFLFVPGPSKVSSRRPGLKSGKSQAAGTTTCTLQPPPPLPHQQPGYRYKRCLGPHLVYSLVAQGPASSKQAAALLPVPSCRDSGPARKQSDQDTVVVAPGEARGELCVNCRRPE